VLGYIWLNTDLILLNTDEDNFHNLIRQTIHAIAMHTNLYTYWKDGTNSPWTGESNYEATDFVMSYPSFVTRAPFYSMQSWKVITTQVLSAARSSFDCTTLDGLQLEDSGNLRKPGSNWDKRYMYNDIMSKGFDSENTVISPMTWAMFLDTGWYTHQNTPQTKLQWGNG
jgi:hypothetical protein